MSSAPRAGYVFAVRLGGFDGDATLPLDVPTLKIFLEALAAANAMVLATRPDFPSLADSGVVYRSSDFDGIERDDIALRCDEALEDVDRDGQAGGDCKTIVAWRIAELRRRGVWCEFGILRADDGDVIRWHPVVRYADGTTEDTCLLLIRAGRVGKARRVA